ncbi:MAG: hypothetical protein ACLQKK_21790 [Rhodomicrobium sp.]
MTLPHKSALPLPQPSLACLQPLTAPDVLAAWVAAQPKKSCAEETAAKALSEALPYAQTLAEAIKLGLIREDAGLLIAKPDSAAKGSYALSGSAAQDALRALAVRALGGPVASGAKRRRDLPALALRQLFALDELAPWPTAQAARCALLSRIVASFGGAFGERARAPLKAFKFDEMSRRIYLAFAGVQRGAVLQADAALLSKALGGPADNVQALTATIIRAAIAARPGGAAETAQTFSLESFAKAVRKIAGRLETKPYAGRVAIAQVYDAGLAQGLALGSLDEFKANLAEAAREGLLDLERYDITGPFDAGLKERSRLRLGRDERHFIVNQWI